MNAYATIVADPPWDMPDSGKRTQAQNGGWADPKWTGKRSIIPYPRMSLQEIAALPVADLAEKDAHLYVWTTNRFLRDTFGIVEGWGFKPSTVLTWCKAPMGLGMGGAFTLTTEFILFARRGSLKPLERMDSTWWEWKRGPHSKKPEAFLDIVERVSPAPRLEMFARRNRLGWHTWGNQSLEHVEVAT